MPNSADLNAKLAGRWKALCEAAGLGEAGAEGRALLSAYAEPQRRYHGLEHISFVLDEIERHAPLLIDIEVAAFSAWYHDAIYDPQARDNELRSAAWAVEDLRRLGFDADRTRNVEAMILKTTSHQAGDVSADEALFLDMDFAILGAPRGGYALYADNIRAEYAHVPDDAFRSGRGAFLRSILAGPRMFRTDLYETERGAQARNNLRWEIARLSR